MTALERIEEVKKYSQPAIQAFSVVNMKKEDIKFLLRAFEVIKVMAIEKISSKERYEDGSSVDDVFKKFEDEFEKRMSQGEGK